MDEAAAAATREDGAERRPRSGDTASENDEGQSAEDVDDINQGSLACEDCGLKFTHWEFFKTHLHQHALEEEEEEEEEEEAEAQVVDERNLEAELEDGENLDEDIDADAHGYDMSSSQTQGAGASTMKKLGKVYSCSICGKVYTYLVSFRKHQLLHEKRIPATKNVHNLNQYDCPYCGMSFIRRARLLGHLRTHRSRRSLESKPARCDQCNKDFTSQKSWMVHVDLHRENPFWCLSCAKGFRDEESLDKHLQSHSLRQHHYNTPTGAEPHQCTLCGKSFSHPENLISHRKSHLRVSGMSLGNSAIIAKERIIKKKRLILARGKEDPVMDTDMEELLGKEERVENSETQEPWEDAEFGDHANFEELDCGEPVHHFKLSNPPGSAGPDPPDESKSETVQPLTGQELDESELQENDTYTEHKYWEWECCECDMGFDEVAKLHLHYIKHATGELPIPQDDTED
ncbi:zinc finger protein 569 isoform X3 [Pempheris klunzingeri]|uniref:zinc finger protein 569 isoform X3 n=1 Tax=Pempheris klunzingeri TaxID=3127111 RepID=UPI0039804C59